MFYRYSRWDGTQEIDPLLADEVLDLLADDLFDEGDVRRALQRLFSRGALRPSGGRLAGLRELLERLRRRRLEQQERYNLGSLLDELQQQLEEIVRQEREGIQRRLAEVQQEDVVSPDQERMRRVIEQLAARKMEALDSLAPDVPGKLQRLMDYEFMDEGARAAFQDLLRRLQQQMLGQYFQGLQQGLQSLTPEDLAGLREMVRELNRLLQQQLEGKPTDADFQRFMERFGDFFPPGISSLDELVRHLHQQAAQMASLLESMPAALRQQLRETLDALLQDDRLRWDMAQLGHLLEQLTGMPLGQRYPLRGQEPLGLAEALRLMEQLRGLDELERQFEAALRALDPNRVDREQVERFLGPEEAAMLEQLQQLTRLMEEAGIIRREGRDLELTARGIRKLGQKALRDIFAELQKDRAGQHSISPAGIGLEQEMETKSWEFGDPFLVDIPKSVTNALFRAGPGTPVVLSPQDLEVYRTEHLTRAATVILLDMSYSMVGSGAFREGKKVAFALNTLIRTQFPKDYLSLVVFSYFATELDPERLLNSDWVEYGGGTNIQEGLSLARKLLAKHKSATRQIILITDAQPTTYTGSWGEPYQWTHVRWSGQRRSQAVEETLKEVRRCTREGITINTFMMSRDPSLMAFAEQMTQINKGRAFFTTPGQLGRYVLVDYLHHKRKLL